MRYPAIILLNILLISGAVAQERNLQNIDITGLWKGTLFNDTTGQYYRYEIAISEEKGKFNGFSHTWFLLDDQQFYGVKKLKIRKVNDKLITEDDGLIANNYPVAPAKGVRQLNVLELVLTDSLLILTGPFTTNQTKKYSPLTGTIRLERKNDYKQSALVPHLQELGMEDKLSFYKEVSKPDYRESIAAANRRQENDMITTSEKISQAEKRTEPVKEKPGKKDPSNPSNQASTTIAIPETGKKATVKNEQKPDEKKTPDVFLPSPVKPAPAAEVDKRKTIVQQTVFVRSDSLQLSLYDNGEVDGDTVSVLMNGKLILEKQRLSTQAVRHTIYIEPGTENIELVMYAENLGSIPPNTGLLVVKDGRDTYEIRFSGDMERNAAIIFKRKKD